MKSPRTRRRPPSGQGPVRVTLNHRRPLLLAGALAAALSGCQSDVGSSIPPVATASPPLRVPSQPAMREVEVKAGGSADNKHVMLLRGVAEAVTAAEFCRLVQPNWPRMSQALSDAGIDGDAQSTTTALDSEAETFKRAMREQRDGAICDRAIVQYGPKGTVFPDFLALPAPGA